MKIGSENKTMFLNYGKVSRKKAAVLLDFVQITSPPPHPNLDNLYNFFSDVKIQNLKVSLGLKVLYI